MQPDEEWFVMELLLHERNCIMLNAALLFEANIVTKQH